MWVIYIYWGTGPSWKILPGAEKKDRTASGDEIPVVVQKGKKKGVCLIHNSPGKFCQVQKKMQDH